MNDKKMLWVATDIKCDCARCAMTYPKCNECCKPIANVLGAFSVYAIKLKEPEKEYQGQ